MLEGTISSLPAWSSAFAVRHGMLQIFAAPPVARPLTLHYYDTVPTRILREG